MISVVLISKAGEIALGTLRQHLFLQLLLVLALLILRLLRPQPLHGGVPIFRHDIRIENGTPAPASDESVQLRTKLGSKRPHTHSRSSTRQGLPFLHCHACTGNCSCRMLRETVHLRRSYGQHHVHPILHHGKARCGTVGSTCTA